MKSKPVVPAYSKKLISLVFLLGNIFAIVTTIFFVVTASQAIILDFISFLTAAEVIKNGEAHQLYNLEVQREYQQEIINPYGLAIGKDVNLLPYLNLPIFGLFYIPFTHFSYLTGYKIYASILVCVLGAISILSGKIFKKLGSFSFWSFIPFIFYPSIGAVFIGQTSVFLVLLFLLIYSAMRESKYLWAGILSSLLLLKVQYAIAIPFFYILSKDRRDFLKGIGIATVILIILNLGLSGFFLHDYFSTLTVTQKEEFGLRSKDMFTLYAFFKQTTPFSNLSFYGLFLLNAALYIITFLFFSVVARKLPFEITFMATTLLVLVFSVHGVNYDLALLLVPIFIMIDKIRASKEVFAIDKISTLTLILLPILFLIGKGVFISLILLGVALLLITRRLYRLPFLAWPH